MSLMEISKSIPQNLDYSQRNKILPKNGTQKSGNSHKMIPKNPGTAHKDTQKSGSNPQKVPKIMARPRIMTYASQPPPPPPPSRNNTLSNNMSRYPVNLITFIASSVS